MAIIFTTPLAGNKWLLTRNNRIVEFSSDYVEDPLFVKITIGSLPFIQIPPLPDNSFWFNFKEYVSGLLVDYADDLDVSSLDGGDVNSFVFDWTKVYTSPLINFEITFTDDTTESTSVTPLFLLGAEQPIDFKQGRVIGSRLDLCLSPLKVGSTDRYYFKYWDGYPFDIGLITESASDFTLNNLTNAASTGNIVNNNVVSRLLISNGLNDIEPYVDFNEGYNDVQIASVDGDPILVDLQKVSDACGVYMKWLNKTGGYSYWLFNRFYTIDKGIQTLGSITNDFYNLEDTTSQSKQLGKDSADLWTLLSDNLSPDDMNIAKGILDSPKAYLFTGTAGQVNNFNDWLEVSVNTRSANIKQSRESRNELSLTIELPNDYNIKL